MQEQYKNIELQIIVEVESGEALVKALETIKIAVEAGELDSQIEIASAKLRSGFGK